jgi:hypothetical protein
MPTGRPRPGSPGPGPAARALLALLSGACALGLIAAAAQPAADPPHGRAAPDAGADTPLFDRGLDLAPGWTRGFARDNGALVFRTEGDARFRAVAGGETAGGFGLPAAGVFDRAAPGAAAPFRPPHLALFSGGTSAAVSSGGDGASGWRWSAAVATRTSLNAPGAPARVGGFVEASGAAGPLRLSGVFGVLKEEGTALGSPQPGGASVRGASSSRVAGGLAALPVGARTTLVAAVHLAETAAAGLHGASGEGAAVGLVFGDVALPRDKVVLSASRPFGFAAGWAESGGGRRPIAQPPPLILDASWRMSPGKGHGLVLRAGAEIRPGPAPDAAAKASFRYRIEF